MNPSSQIIITQATQDLPPCPISLLPHRPSYLKPQPPFYQKGSPHQINHLVYQLINWSFAKITTRLSLSTITMVAILRPRAPSGNQSGATTQPGIFPNHPQSDDLPTDSTVE